MVRARPRRRPLVPLVVCLMLVGSLASLTPAGAVVAPSVRLFSAQSTITVERDRRDFVSFDPGIWITPVAGDFELRVARPDYEHPIAFTQQDAETGSTLRTLPVDLLDGFYGLKDFAKVEVFDADGTLLLRNPTPWCPNSSFPQRLSDESPLVPTYPSWCGGGPFTRGMIWGINEGWATSLVGGDYYYYGIGFKAPRKHYTVRATIRPRLVDLLGVAPEDAVTEVHVVAVDRGTLDGASAPPQPAAASSSSPTLAVPDTTDPPPESLPDLFALPAWSMSIDERKGREFLTFNSTEWNEGPGTFVIEGFREPDAATMDAFQYFLVDGEPVGRSEIGQLEYHQGGGHNHWHFEEFTEYTLLDADKNLVLVSGKQSWCLVNTDAIDLTVPNANLQARGQDLSTSCGGPGAVWIREVLDVGWGDTYFQYVSGQAFDITDVPNGTYFVRVHVNPTGSILEGSADNNIEDRLIRIKGKPGNRRVVVPPWNGIDTEHYCYYCG